MSRTILALLALVGALATGCGEVGLPEFADVAPPPQLDATHEHRAALLDGVTDSLRPGAAAVLLDSAPDGLADALDGLLPVEVARLATAMHAFSVPGADLEAQIDHVLDDDRILTRPAELPTGPATWVTWSADGVLHGALFDRDSATLLGTARQQL